jgi:hypothetical protein
MELLPLKFSDEELEQIMNFAACNYAPELVAAQMNLDKEQFMTLWNNTGSDVRQAYEAGKLKARFNIMNKQRELAESGNITAAQIFLKESKETEIASIRDKILYGGW